MGNHLDRHAVFCELVGDVARSAGEVCLRVTGASMLPAVWPGDFLTVRHCGLSELQPGHIALYRREGRLTAHRIKNVLANQVITKGDSLVDIDPPVEDSQIIGQVVSITHGRRSIEPKQTGWQRSASLILSRSDFLMRITLSIGRRLQRSNSPQPHEIIPPTEGN